MSIAWAIVEYLHRTSLKPKTLFATHYHELNEMETFLERVRNYHISTQEVDGHVIFLRKLCEGGVASSFGIHVARMAGMPQEVLYAAQKKLDSLENKTAGDPSTSPGTTKGMQLSFFQLDDPLLLDIKHIIEKIDINTLSPLNAFDTIRQIKNKLAGGKDDGNLSPNQN